MVKKSTAHRPSQANQQYVKNSKGETVLNTAYQGKKQQSHSDINDYNDFDFKESLSAPLSDINELLTSDLNKNISIVKKELSRYRNDDQIVKLLDNFTAGPHDENVAYFSVGKDDWSAISRFYKLKDGKLERNLTIMNKWHLDDSSDDKWGVKPKNDLERFTVFVNDVVVDNPSRDIDDIMSHLGDNYDLVHTSGIQIDYYTDNIVLDKSTGKYYNIHAQETGWDDIDVMSVYEVEPQECEIDNFTQPESSEIKYKSSKLNKMLENSADGTVKNYWQLFNNDNDLETINVFSYDDSLSELNPEGTNFNLSSSENKQNDRYYNHGIIYHDPDTNEYLAIQLASASEDSGSWEDGLDIVKNDNGTYTSEYGNMWKLEKNGTTSTTIYRPVNEKYL